MQKFLIILTVLISINTQASWENCRDEIKALITHPTDQYILSVNEELINKYGFAKCEDLHMSLELSVHEAVHFLDLNIAAMPTTPDPKFNFFDIFQGFFIEPNRRTAKSEITIESPQDVIRRYSLRNQDKWNMISDEFKRKYDLYIADLNAAAGKTLLIGTATELNAYTHGLMAAQRILENSGKANLGVAGERNGMLSFLIFFQIYIDQARFENGKNWELLAGDSAAKSIISDLTSESIKAIEATNICTTTIPQLDRPLLKDVQLFFNHDAFSEIVGSDLSKKLMEVVICK